MIIKHLLILVIAHCGGMPTGTAPIASTTNCTSFTECSSVSTQVSNSTHNCCCITPLNTTKQKDHFSDHAVVIPQLRGNYLYSKILKLDKGVYAAYIRKAKRNTEIRANLTKALMICMTGPKGHFNYKRNLIFI